MRNLLALLLIVTVAGCGGARPTDRELRLAAKSELRKQDKSSSEQAAVDALPLTGVRCTGADAATVCTFKVGETAFKKTFARTGSGAWSAYDGDTAQVDATQTRMSE